MMLKLTSITDTILSQLKFFIVINIVKLIILQLYIVVQKSICSQGKDAARVVLKEKISLRTSQRRRYPVRAVFVGQ